MKLGHKGKKSMDGLVLLLHLGGAVDWSGGGIQWTQENQRPLWADNVSGSFSLEGCIPVDQFPGDTMKDNEDYKWLQKPKLKIQYLKTKQNIKWI